MPANAQGGHPGPGMGGGGQEAAPRRKDWGAGGAGGTQSVWERIPEDGLADCQPVFWFSGRSPQEVRAPRGASGCRGEVPFAQAPGVSARARAFRPPPSARRWEPAPAPRAPARPPRDPGQAAAREGVSTPGQGDRARPSPPRCCRARTGSPRPGRPGPHARPLSRSQRAPPPPHRCRRGARPAARPPRPAPAGEGAYLARCAGSQDTDSRSRPPPSGLAVRSVRRPLPGAARPPRGLIHAPAPAPPAPAPACPGSTWGRGGPTRGAPAFLRPPPPPASPRPPGPAAVPGPAPRGPPSRARRPPEPRAPFGPPRARGVHV